MQSNDNERRRERLSHYLQAQFGEMNPEVLAAVCAHFTWVELEAGEVLMQQGQVADAAYLSLSGRLRVYVEGPEEGQRRAVRELGRGEILGEIGLYSEAPRSATVVALRHSVLARLEKAQFHELVQRYPQASFALTRQIIERLQTQHNSRPETAPVMLCLLPITAHVQQAELADKLRLALAQHGRTCCVGAAQVRAQALQQHGQADDAACALVLDELETQHDFVLMLADSADEGWSRLCTRHADEILLLAQASEPAQIHPIEHACLSALLQASEPNQTLLLLHPAELKSPLGMRRWLDRRPVGAHLNLRPALERDVQRLARIISHNATGLVLAGGGARGLAHLGVWKELQRRGIEIDCVGGTSIGAVMGALIAADAGVEPTIERARRAFRINPTGDYNWLPLVSLIRGRRVRQLIDSTFHELTGGQADVVDLWKGFFCIASNYSRGQELRLQQGDLSQALRASLAIPGALPPVVRDGELLCDGGTFNNFPVNVMRQQRGVRRVIGVDLGARSTRRLTFDEIPGPWALLLDRLRPRARQRYRLPSLVSYLLNVSILYSVSRQAESRRQCDLYLNPPLPKIGLLQWNQFETIVSQGEQHAREVLDQAEGGVAAPPS